MRYDLFALLQTSPCPPQSDLTGWPLAAMLIALFACIAFILHDGPLIKIDRSVNNYGSDTEDDDE